MIPDSTIDRLLKAMQPQTKGAMYEKVADVVEDMVAEGWSATQVVGQLYDKIVLDDAISDRAKNRIIMSFSEADKRLNDGSDEHLTVSAIGGPHCDETVLPNAGYVRVALLT